MAVPDGARIRLAQEGPELQVTFETAAEVEAPAAPPATVADSSIGQKQAVGRETLLREIGRAKQEERDAMAGEVARAKRSTGRWIAIGGLGIAALLAIGLALMYFMGGKRLDETVEAQEAKLAEVTAEVGKNVWADIEQQVSPSTAHIRSRYHLKLPFNPNAGETVYAELLGGQVEGSGILIKDGVVLTAAHIVEPWRGALENWEEFAQETSAIAELAHLDVQFPGQQPVVATVIAISENRDLALLGLTPNSRTPIPVEPDNEAVSVTDEVSIFGYPGTLGQYVLLAESTRGADEQFAELKEVVPTFLLGTVTLPVRSTADLSHHFFLDASAEPGNSGGPVVNQEGRLIGIISQRYEVDEEISIFGRMETRRRAVGGSVQAVSPNDIREFLVRAGVN
jgi:S1-C subfamily serine protease